MGQIGSLNIFAPNTIISSALINANNSDIKTPYNAHDIAVNGVHGVTGGAIMGTAADETVTGEKTFDVGKLKVDTETRYYSVNPTAFHSTDGADEDNKYADGSKLYNNDAGFGVQNFIAPINLPQGATITSFKCYYYRDDASASLTLDLNKFDSTGGSTAMAALTASGTGGSGSVEDTTITEPIIDNNGNSYRILASINNNNSVLDAYVYNVIITYTTDQPLP